MSGPETSSIVDGRVSRKPITPNMNPDDSCDGKHQGGQIAFVIIVVREFPVIVRIAILNQAIDFVSTPAFLN